MFFIGLIIGPIIGIKIFFGKGKEEKEVRRSSKGRSPRMPRVRVPRINIPFL
jgi:hypothetical protein